MVNHIVQYTCRFNSISSYVFIEFIDQRLEDDYWAHYGQYFMMHAFLRYCDSIVVNGQKKPKQVG